MCPLSVIFFASFLAGVLTGGAVAVSVVMLAFGGPTAVVAVVWGGGLLGSLAIFATALAQRITSTACRLAGRQE